MFYTILSATWYADVALIVLVLLFALMGVIKGFGKSLKGFFAGIFIILAACLLMGLSHNAVVGSALGTKLQTSLGGIFTNLGDAYNRPVYIDGAGEYYVLVNGEVTPLSSFGMLHGTIANTLAKTFISGETELSIAEACVYNLTSLICMVIMVVVYAVALGIIFAILRGATKGMRESDSTAVRVTDKVLGGVIGLILGVTFIFLVLAIFKALSGRIPFVEEYINQSSVCKFFYDLNPIGKVFARTFAKN